MSEANWEFQSVEPSANVVSKGGEVVIFHVEQVPDHFQTQQQNRPVFREKTFIKILTGGDNLVVNDRPITVKDKEKYAVQWERWEATHKNQVTGMPIDLWHSITPTQKAEFKALNILTIEQFAGLPDSMAPKIMGFHGLRDKAKIYLEAGKDAEMLGKVRAEAEAVAQAQRAEIAALREELKAATDAMKRLPLRPARLRHFKPQPDRGTTTNFPPETT